MKITRRDALKVGVGFIFSTPLLASEPNPEPSPCEEDILMPEWTDVLISDQVIEHNGPKRLMVFNHDPDLFIPFHCHGSDVLIYPDNANLRISVNYPYHYMKFYKGEAGWYPATQAVKIWKEFHKQNNLTLKVWEVDDGEQHYYLAYTANDALCQYLQPLWNPNRRDDYIAEIFNNTKVRRVSDDEELTIVTDDTSFTNWVDHIPWKQDGTQWKGTAQANQWTLLDNRGLLCTTVW